MGPVEVRLIVGGIAGAVIGAIIVFTTMLKAWRIAGWVHPPGSPWSLLPCVLIFTVAGLLAGWLTGVRSAWLRHPSIGAVVGSAAGSFLAISHPYASLIQPPQWTVPQATTACGMVGMVIGAAAAAIDSLRSRR
ncbi:MAG: hypothetical protein HZB91_04250 [Elusimicrobia bacterium]|nr:hypothetical protein [Elusimicrobiota bacterium]